MSSTYYTSFSSIQFRNVGSNPVWGSEFGSFGDVEKHVAKFITWDKKQSRIGSWKLAVNDW